MWSEYDGSLRTYAIPDNKLRIDIQVEKTKASFQDLVTQVDTSNQNMINEYETMGINDIQVYG